MDKMMRIAVVLILAWGGVASLGVELSVAEKKHSEANLVLEQLAKGLDVPWGMAFVAPKELLFTQQVGTIAVLDLTTGSIKELSGSPVVHAQGQGGLMDVALPPGYRPGGWIYFTYSKKVDGQGATTLARAHRQGLRLVDWQDLLITDSKSGTNVHYGSRIAFDGAGHLFFTVGDRGVRPNAQDRSNHAGTVLRVRLDGSLPPDNPFVNQTDVRPEIYSYGHRNPQGIAYDFNRQRLWIIEHGPRGGDEINLVKPGRNYGWPVISYGKEYWGPLAVGEGTHRAGMEQPVKVYVPSIAPGSLLLYSGKAFGAWKGNLLAGALKLRHINRIVLNEEGNALTEARLLQSLDERIRALIEGPEGWIYFSTDSGGIYRLGPRKSNPD